MKQILTQLKALADPARLKVVRRLMRGNAYVSALKTATKAEPTLLSHHLGVLKDAGIVKSKRIGKRVFYSLCVKSNKNYLTLRKFSILFD